MPQWENQPSPCTLLCLRYPFIWQAYVQKLAAKETSSQLVLLKAEHAMHCSVSSLRCIITHTQLIAPCRLFQRLRSAFDQHMDFLCWTSTYHKMGLPYDSTVAFSLSKISCLVGPGSHLFRLLVINSRSILSTQEKPSHDLRLWRSKFEWVLFNVIQLSPCFFPKLHISHHCPHSHNKGNRGAPLL